MTRILTVTLNPAVDTSTSVSRVAPDRKLRCGRPARDPGGGGLNVARAARELGAAEVEALWTCGGTLGRLLAQLLDAEGVSHEAIPIAADTRENLIVLEEETEQQYRFGFPGAELTTEEAERCGAALRARAPDGDLVVLSGSLPPGVEDDFYARLAAEVSDRARVILDTSGAPLREAVAAGGLFLVKPNLRELAELAGRELDDDLLIEEAARELVAGGGVEAVLVSLGAGGAVLVSGGEVTRIRAPTVRIRSKVGAGDSTVAGLVVGLERGEPLERAACLGVAAGAACVMTEGTSLCRREDTERLFGEMCG